MCDRSKTDLDRDGDQTNAGLQAIEKLRGASVAPRTQKAWNRMLEEHRCKGNQECGANGPSQTQVLCNHGFQACVSDCPESAQSVFFKEKVNSVWLTDITYVPIRDGFAYLCCVEDLCSRRIVGWSIALHMEASLALDALEQAIALRVPSRGLIVHSDRGSQFASEAYRNRLEKGGFEQSMSRKGNCYDNAPMESFFRSFKVEDANQQPYETLEHATREIADYIDRFYNPVRLHSSLGYQSPIQFEKGQIESLELCS